MDEPAPAPASAPAPTETNYVKTHASEDVDLFADADFVSATPLGDAKVDYVTQVSTLLFRLVPKSCLLLTTYYCYVGKKNYISCEILNISLFFCLHVNFFSILFDNYTSILTLSLYTSTVKC